MTEEQDTDYILAVKELQKYFPVRSGPFSTTKGFVKAVDNVSFLLEEGQTLGIVGESGSGKSTLARTIARLVNPTDGSVVLLGKRVDRLSRKELRRFRVNFQMVFQDPISSLNPRQLAVDIVGEPLKLHFGLRGEELTKEVIKLMQEVGLEKSQLYRYPHEFSGGQRQRLGLARALSVKPKLLILDEPTSNLDVSVQSQILKLLLSLQKRLNLTYLFISHDIAVVYHMSHVIMVMYAGKVVEKARTDILFNKASHPYTRALLSIVVSEGKDIEDAIGGEPPSMHSLPPGCRFHPRCPYRVDKCEKVEPELVDIGDDHLVSCHVFAPGPDIRESEDGKA